MNFKVTFITSKSKLGIEWKLPKMFLVKLINGACNYCHLYFFKKVISVDEKGLFFEKVSREQPNRTVNLMFAQYVI